MNLKIKTDQPIFEAHEQITQKIAKFWDQISDGWRIVWGPHIHHGYFENNFSTPLEAQEKLIEKLAQLVPIASGESILDVGCGMGGSSLYLAKKYKARIIGVTLSQKQAIIATKQAEKANVKNVFFKVEDALSLPSIADNSFDVVWSLESCEQFYDKSLFLKQAHRVLKPGGKLMLATWCSSHDEYTGKLAKKYYRLCHAFDVPYMPTLEWYDALLSSHHFNVTNRMDWSPFVKKSWDIGVSMINIYSFIKLLKMGGWRGVLFSKQVKLMQDAFQQNRVRYGVFIATKK